MPAEVVFEPLNLGSGVDCRTNCPATVGQPALFYLNVWNIFWSLGGVKKFPLSSSSLCRCNKPFYRRIFYVQFLYLTQRMVKMEGLSNFFVCLTRRILVECTRLTVPVCSRHDRTSRQTMNLKWDVSVPVPPVPFLTSYNKTSFLVQIKFITEDSKWFIYKY